MILDTEKRLILDTKILRFFSEKRIENQLIFYTIRFDAKMRIKIRYKKDKINTVLSTL